VLQGSYPHLQVPRMDASEEHFRRMRNEAEGHQRTGPSLQVGEEDAAELRRDGTVNGPPGSFLSLSLGMRNDPLSTSSRKRGEEISAATPAHAGAGTVISLGLSLGLSSDDGVKRQRASDDSGSGVVTGGKNAPKLPPARPGRVSFRTRCSTATVSSELIATTCWGAFMTT
jgi:hypothetical protein